MRKILTTLVGLMAFGCLAVSTAQATDVNAMYGGVLIDGYEFGSDTGPKGSIRFDAEKGEFIGYYTGMKMPAGRRAIFAWVHDTVNQKSEYIGPVGWLKLDTGGKTKGRFQIAVPEAFKSGDFGTNEIIAFTSEKTDFLDDQGNVVQQPEKPSGSDIQKELNPAFYLFAALPGADTDLHYCGHGQDFFFAKALDKQVCYD